MEDNIIYAQCVLGRAVNRNDNPLCAIATLYVGEGRSFYCDMFGNYIIIHRPKTKSAIYILELLVNTDNGSE